MNTNSPHVQLSTIWWTWHSVTCCWTVYFGVVFWEKKKEQKIKFRFTDSDYPFGLFKLFFDQRIRKQANKFINRSVSKILHTLKIFLWNKRYSTRILNRCLLWIKKLRTVLNSIVFY
jgi:hypothetical protein